MAYRRKKHIVILIILLGCIVCSAYFYKIINETAMKEAVTETGKEYTEVIGYIEHGPSEPNLSENGELLPYEYYGGEYELKYYLNTSGMAKNVGFMVFINGNPVSLRVNTKNDFNFCPYIELKEGKENYTFSLFFSLPPGKKGDVKKIDVISIYNPDFKPDMKEFTSYTINHSALISQYEIRYNLDVKEENPIINKNKNIMTNLKMEKEEIANDLLKEEFDIPDDDQNVYLLNNSFYKLYFNNKVIYNSLKLENELLHIRYKIVGCPGLKYQTTFYIDHKPIDNNSITTYENILEKGKTCVIDAYIDYSGLPDKSTFYLISIPVNVDDYPNAGVGVYKSPSVLLYK